MTSLQPNFSNSSKWQLVFSSSVNAVIINQKEQIHAPIPTIKIPIQIGNTAVAILTDTKEGKSTWKCGGWLSINVNTGLTVGGDPDAEIARFFLRLGKINITRIPTLSYSYSLFLEVPYWFKFIEYYLWEYTGDGIADIEGKLDQINRLIEIN